METHILWSPTQETGLEHLYLQEESTGVYADSIVLGFDNDLPFRLKYQMHANHDWRLQNCLLQTGIAWEKNLHLYSDGQGNWTDATHTPLSALTSCQYIDINVTPFTNSLPVRHLGLQPGQATEILVAYITVPNLEVRPVRQRYTCLSITETGGVYRYEGLEDGFTRDLHVDAQGLVLDYPGIWRRAA